MTKADCLPRDVDRYSADILVLPVRTMRFPRQATGARAGCPPASPPIPHARSPGLGGRVLAMLAALARALTAPRPMLAVHELSDHVQRDIGVGRYGRERLRLRSGEVIPIRRRPDG